MTVIAYQPRSKLGRFQKPAIRQPLADQRPPDQVGPTPAWFRLRFHPEQHRLSLPGEPRFRVVPSGRRSGKCLAAGALVAMADGTFRPVETVQAGDLVLSMTDAYRIAPARVTHVHANGCREVVRVRTTGRQITCTPNHPFLIDNCWTEAADAKPGQLIAVPRALAAFGSVPMDLADGDVAWEEIVAIEPAGEAATYDLTVDGVHTFVAEGFVTHNTEVCKRFGVRLAFRRAAEVTWPDPRIGFGAPTYTQARKLYWADLKRLIPRELFARPPRESEMKIELVTGVEIYVVGLDSAERLEGIPWDALFMDEFANIRENSWAEHIRPALADRRGIAWLFGVPEGAGEYQRLYERAALGQDPAWGAYHWRSEDILPAEEIASARGDMDEHSFEQEFGGRFLTRAGAAYYKFARAIHAAHPLRPLYRATDPLIVCFDFNVVPGVAVIAQEMRLPNGELGTGVIGEVYVERDSNTEKVARAIATQWGQHAGEVLMFGDSTGGSRSTSGLFGSDWDVVKAVLHPVFGARLRNRVETNPPEKSRVNSLNSRLMSISGTVRLMVDPRHAPELVRDFENVRLKEDGSGAIDKRPGPFTHLCFGPETVVETLEGFHAINEVPATGFVRGFDGTFVPYEAAGRTGIDREIVSVCIDGEQALTCTPEHRFLTAEGWKWAADLTPSSILRTWSSAFSPLRFSSSRGCASTDMTRNDISPTQKSQARPICTCASGRPPTARCLLAFMCTMQPMTRLGMHSRISSCSVPAITSGIISPQILDGARSRQLFCEKRAPLQRHGTDHRKDAPGTENMHPAQRLASINEPANGVAGDFWQLSRPQDCAPTNARPQSGGNPGSMTRTALAQYVAALTGGADTFVASKLAAELAAGSLRVNAVKPAGRSDVYCLLVPGDGCFALANGAIVSNSDAIGYYVASKWPVGGGRVVLGTSKIRVG